jgi:hypothetical protein
MRRTVIPAVFAAALVTVPGAIGLRVLGAAPAPAAAPSKDPAQVERGAYLVGSMGCHDCHTPWKIGAKGPEPDMSRALTGHPQDVKVPPAPTLPEGWAWAAAPTNTAFAGAWGTSFTANLTPDPETGLGKWTEEMFLTALRTGRHEGKGRPILPPMPWPMIGKLTDADLRAVFAYLQSLPPVKNRVPQPVDPPEAGR